MTGEAGSSAYQGRMRLGRYELFKEFASGGMATIHLGRVVGAGSFARAVAIKRLHQQYARDAEFARMFLDEADIVARIHHPNVLPTLDVIEQDGDLFIVMELIEGVTLKHLMQVADRNGERVPWTVALAILGDVLGGLHAAHELNSEQGKPLQLVHRDVAPDNVLVGVDGVGRLFDFGIAKALGQAHTTQAGQIKGKIAYTPPEQLLGKPLDRRADLFSASVVLWEALTGHRLFERPDVGRSMHRLLHLKIPPPSALAHHLPEQLDAVVLRGLARDPAERWPTAVAMREALADIGGAASSSEVGQWVRELAAERLGTLTAALAEMERTPPLKDGGVTPRATVASATSSSIAARPGSTRRYVAMVLAAVAAVAAVSFFIGFEGSRSAASVGDGQVVDSRPARGGDPSRHLAGAREPAAAPETAAATSAGPAASAASAQAGSASAPLPPARPTALPTGPLPKRPARGPAADSSARKPPGGLYSRQ